jgi:PIN domain nuclease of toxin-antitoxin system
MILLDTHIWVWWAGRTARLTEQITELLLANEQEGLGVSVISCWEIAKLVEVGRLELSIPVNEWIEYALALPGIQLLALTPEIAIASTQLPGDFHRDPADQIIVATARTYAISLLTVDARIRAYEHVQILE